MKIKPGTIQELTVFDENDRVYLLGAEHDLVVLGKWEIDSKNPLKEGDRVKVFTFYNDKSELEATVELPRIEVGQVGMFKVKNVNQIGAFIDIGTRRDILIPFPQQRVELQAGKHALVILQDDAMNKRLFASTKIVHFMHNTTVPYERGDEVNLIIADKIDIGRRVIINGTHIGVLFRQEMISRVHEGETIKGYVRKVEGKDIQVSLQKEGLELLEDGKKRVMTYLELNNGYARLSDDSDSEEIKLRLRMSKKTFKKVVGMLYKEGKVLITKFGVKINKTGEIPTEPYPMKAPPKQSDTSVRKGTTERSYGDQRGERRTRENKAPENQNSRSRRPERSGTTTAPRTHAPRTSADRQSSGSRPGERDGRGRSRGDNSRDDSRYQRSEKPRTTRGGAASEKRSSDAQDRRTQRPASGAPRRTENRPSDRTERSPRPRDYNDAPRKRSEDGAPRKTLKFDKSPSSKPPGRKRS
jgi:uncharacterized protein